MTERALLTRLLTEEYLHMAIRDNGTAYLIVDGFFEITPEEAVLVDAILDAASVVSA